MDPVEALNEIAFLLEKSLASSFKTKAFRTAAGVLDGIPAEELAERASSGRLKSMKGIGGTTYEVITQALEGEVPAYLADLREHAAPAPTEGVELRAALKGDLHSHSEWSDGTTSIESMAATARWLGHDYLVLTDHSPRLKI